MDAITRSPSTSNARSAGHGHGRDAEAKEKRVSRACVACRRRKTRCRLYANDSSGGPPCARCLQEGLECTLATSRRGGRRPRKQTIPAAVAPAPAPASASASVSPTIHDRNHGSLARPPSQGLAPGHTGGSLFALGQQQQPPLPPPPPPLEHSRNNNEHVRMRQRPPLPPSAGPLPATRQEQGTSPRALLPSTPGTTNSHGFRRRSARINTDIDGDFATRDLLNPSDALNLLAQVADLDGEHPGNDARPSSSSNGPIDMDMDMSHGPMQMATSDPVPFYYPPISDGLLSFADATYLLSHYQEKYHPFFPVADKRIFDGRDDIPALVQSELHLLTGVFTVATKDDPAWHRVHEACSSHMGNLIARLVYEGATTVGAVEALLILAEWAPQRRQNKPTIGRGEEDQGAWMQIGMAIRLAYLQGLEQSTVLQDKAQRSPDTERQRIAWTACYMSDREVSIRLGKGFWSRQPGPSSVLNANDFPTLRAQQVGSSDLAQLFHARLEMIQLFSNAHDILYSSTTHREQLFTGGEYVRYIDDFSAVLRKWKLEWGSLSLTPAVKAALILSYEFLRLYINAFAFQANISRAIARARQAPPHMRPPARPLLSDLPGAPDARFLYESIDAANTLLNTLNDFVDPATSLRYMPLKYYLYVIYAVVFLFKARASGALAGESSSSARRTISVTIDRLQKSSPDPHSLGQRYARSLYLLLRKSADRVAAGRLEAAASAPQDPSSQRGDSGAVDPTEAAGAGTAVGSGTAGSGEERLVASEVNPLTGFSWRDLDGLGQFIGNNTNFIGINFATPVSDSDQGMTGLDAVPDAWQDAFWPGNDVVF
ncbi:fungal specific transcription factor domain-containing protein [Niveomyces insectorum RCEF 264]|uniref:Fungal specific transcription factor domain-containing protein n=1 Tax=Niveomyces insectorum RCEF 264 TaxID=1081102 RepID=A0A167P3B2_9HYPO|nr:fungal specific transcription factor domain-containing protein [Niveomyces insectorum RCEF 264]